MNPQNFLENWRQLPLSKLFQRAADFPVGAKPKVRADVLQQFYPDYPLLPIEFLKFFPRDVEAEFSSTAPIVHHFLSSGTTMRDRSRSSFTALGLNHYHEFSLLSFRAMLATFFGDKARPRGISFIPDTKEWPSSSLAQMVDWIRKSSQLISRFRAKAMAVSSSMTEFVRTSACHFAPRIALSFEVMEPFN
ncbi:MAG: hypothetical protein EOP07_11355 [Proteobacteria bacterium]|nr:MAG: hypothetical protein EOP07_11355 [Pseudomonadota bacterium]